MKITPVYFSQATALLGRRMVDLSELNGLQNQIQGFVKTTETVRDSTLINLAGPIEVELTNFIRLARAKGRRLCRIVEVSHTAIFPDWLVALDVVVIHFWKPSGLQNPEVYNKAIQTLWFARQEISICCCVRRPEDVPIVELLYSYTPNDVDFYVEIRGHRSVATDPEYLLDVFREDRFATARIVVPRSDGSPL